ncbi:MAG: hypothetical protein Q9197_004968 [Variospora fuerteventurae]
MSSFPSLASNLIAAVSGKKKPLSSGSDDVPDVTNKEIHEQITPLVMPMMDHPPEPQTPKTRGRRRSSQSKTSYQLAHPPPTVKNRHRLRIRPRILLQLRQMSSASQPAPVIDVLPSGLFAPRLARKVPQVFQGKQGLGLDDLVFVCSQMQDFAITTADRLPHEIKEREPNDHEIVAAIYQPKKREDNRMSRTEIRFSHGKSWKAIALRSGAYEFVSQERGETRSIARWIPKKEVNAERSTNMQNPRKSNSQRFKFSLIDSRCRRHPVIANMSRQSIDIYDRYTIPSMPPSPSQYTDAESLDSADSGGYDKTESGEWDEYCKTMIETDEDLRTTIAITGIWVALCEGWSPNFTCGTRQVISNGVSELSNRRRSDSTQSVSSVPYELHGQHQLESGNGSRSRPGMIHMSSLSSVPSSTSLSSPLMSPRRTVSSYASGFDHDAFRRRAPDERDNLRDSTILAIGSDVEQGGSQRSSLATKALLRGRIGAEQEAGTGEDISVGADALPIETRDERKQSRQDMVSEATTLVEKESKKTGKLRRVIARLRRTRRAR